MRAAPERLVLATYPVVSEIAPRYQDMDPLRHLNNVAQAAYFEEGVMALHRRALEGAPRIPGHRVIFELNFKFLAEAGYPGLLQIGGGVEQVGRTSYRLAQALFQDGRCISLNETTAVHIEDGRSAPLPAALRERIEALRFARAPEAQA